LNEADRLCVTSTAQTEDTAKFQVAYAALTEPELAKLRIDRADATFTQAKFTALATRLLEAGPIALRRYKSDAANADPKRVYSLQDLKTYGFTEDLLNFKAWKGNEAQYCMFLASAYKYPLTLAQQEELKADYIKIDGTAKQYKADKADTTFDFKTKYTKETSLGSYALLKYDATAFQIWDGSETKPTDIFAARTFTKFSISTETVVKRITFGKLGWNRVLNAAWDYSANKDKLATGVTLGAFTATDQISNDRKAILIALKEFMTDTTVPAAVRVNNNTDHPALADLSSYGFTAAWIAKSDVNAALLKEIFAYAKDTVKPIAAFNTEAKAGTETRLRFDTPKYYDLYSKYDVLKFGKTVIDLVYSNVSTQTKETNATKLKKLNWILAQVNATGNTYVVAYASLTAANKVTFDAKITADAANYSNTSTKYVIGAVIAAAAYDARIGLGTDLAAQGYTVGEHVQHFVSAATLKKISTQTKTKDAATQPSSAEAVLMTSINAALITNSAFNTANVGVGKTYSIKNAFFQLYFNTKLDAWTTVEKRTAIAAPKIATLGKARFVVKGTDGNVDWKKSGLLIQSYIADTPAAALDLLMANDWNETKFAEIFTLVAAVEDRFATIDASILVKNKVFTQVQIDAMTFRRQAFEVALYEYTFTGEAGYTAAQFEEYALTVALRDKYIDEARLTNKDFATIYASAVTKAATIKDAVVYTAAELKLIASVPTGVATMTVKQQAGILELVNYLNQYKKQPTAELFGFSKVQALYPGLTADYQTLFIQYADSYKNYYVDAYNYQITGRSSTAGATNYSSKAHVRGFLAVIQLRETYPTVDFKKAVSAVALETVLTDKNLDLLNLDMAWWLKRWYTESQIRYIIRQALKEIDSEPTTQKLTTAGLTVDQYAFIKKQDYAVLYAEKILVAVEGARNAGVKVPLGLPAPGASLTAISAYVPAELEILGINVKFVVQMAFTYDSFVTFVTKRAELDKQYATTTAGVKTLAATFPIADIGLTDLTKKSVSVAEQLLNLTKYQLYETWYSGYAKFSKMARTLTFSMTKAQADKYPMTAKDIQVNNLDKEDQERIINKAHQICTAVGTGNFSAAQILIAEYQNTASAVNDLTKAATEAAKTVTTKEPTCYKIALNLSTFITDKRLADYGLDLPYYSAHWWTPEDTHVTLIYAEMQNAKELATWDAATVTKVTAADATYTKMDKPKKSLRFAYQTLKDLTSFTYTTDATKTADAIDVTAAGELIKKGFTVADMSRHAITEARAKVIQTYLAGYKTTESLTQDVLETPKANGNALLDTDAKKIREIALYQNQVYPYQMAKFASVYLDFHMYGLSRKVVTKHFNQHLLVAEEWDRILVAAKALAALSSFPSTTQLGYKLKSADGTLVTAANVATLVGKSNYAGAVALYEYLNAYENLSSNRHVTPETLDQYGFGLLLAKYPGLKDSDQQAWYTLVNAEEDKAQTIDALFTAAKVTKATVGSLTESQLIGQAAFYAYQTANATRDFTKADVAGFTGTDTKDYAIDFTNYAEKSWYTQQDLLTILNDAKSLTTLKNTAGAVVFTNADLILGNFGDADISLTDKQKAGRIAFRRFDAAREAEAKAAGKTSFVYSDKSLTIKEYDFRNAGYDGDSFTKYDMHPDGILAKGIGYVNGQNDGFVAIEIAKYIVKVYNTDAKLNTLKAAVGSTASSSEWTALGTDANKKAGAIAGNIVNRPLHAKSAFTYTDAAMFGVASLTVADADKAKTEWFLAEAKKRYMSMALITEAEELLIKAQMIADFGTGTDITTFTLRQWTYALTKKNNVALPADPVPTGATAWVAYSAGKTLGDSLTYGVYSLPMMYPSLYVSSISANNAARNEIFKSIKTKMTADAKLTLNAAATSAFADYVKVNTTFRKDQKPLEYSSADVTKYLGTFGAKFDNKSTNNIMDIAVKNITTGIFGGAKNFWEIPSTGGNTEAQSVKFTTYKTLFTNVKIDIANIVDDATAAVAPKVKASSAVGSAAIDLYFSGKKIDQIVFIAASATDKTSYGITEKRIAELDLKEEDIKTIIEIAKSYDASIDGILKQDVYEAFSYLSTTEVDKLPAKTRSGQLAMAEFNTNRTKYTVVAKPVAEQVDLGFDDAELLALGVTRLDVADGKENVCTIRAKSYAKVITTAVTGGKAWSTYPQYTTLVENNTAVPKGDKSTDAQKADQIAWLYVTAEIGQKPRTKSELLSFNNSLLTVCDLFESDFAKLEGGKYFDGSAVTNTCTKYGGVTSDKFTYTDAQAASVGLTSVDSARRIKSNAEMQKLLCGKAAQDTVVAERKASKTKLNALDLVSIIKYYGYTEDYVIKATGLSFGNIADYADDLTVDSIGNMIFNYKYTDGAKSGFASDRFKFAALQAGMTQKFFENRGMNKFEIMKYLDDFESFSSKDARSVYSIADVAKVNSATDVALFATIAERDVVAFANTASLDQKNTWLQANGLVCKADFASTQVKGATNATTIKDNAALKDKTYVVDGQTVSFCNRYTSTSSPLYKSKAAADDIRAPKTNVDNLKRVLTKAKFETLRGSGADAVYSYDNLCEAVAMFPAFCDVTQTIEDCRQQVAAFMAVTSVLTTSATVPFKATEETCTVSAGTRACLNYPTVESIEAHYMLKLAIQYDEADADFVFGTTSFKKRGAGMISGMEQYWRFGQAMGAYKTVGTSPVSGLLSSSAASMFTTTNDRFSTPYNRFFTKPSSMSGAEYWATGLWRFLTPTTTESLTSFTEKNSPTTKAVTYSFEDSYQTPSANHWLLGKVATSTEYATVFASGDLKGFRGVAKSYFGADCKKANQSADVTAAIAAFSTWLTGVGGTARGVNDCTLTEALVLPVAAKFDSPFYFSPSSASIGEKGDIVEVYAAAGTCLNVSLPTPFRVFETGSYRECVKSNYDQYFAPSATL
jgi:hypothetical protein